MFLKTEKESCVFKRIRIRVDRASFIGVPSRCIKLACPFISEALTTIYNPSLQQGTVPDIPKNNPSRQGGPTQPTLRISLSVLSEVFEKLVFK